MRVARLEIFGFKSFMDRLVLPLGGGITGIVGPNGCGKSNVVDALRWVLGETRASSLRGETLEDVIFNGTETLRPLGVAEVTLVIRAAGDTFADEIAVQEIVAAETEKVEQISLEPANADEQQSNQDEQQQEQQNTRQSILNSLNEVQITRRLYRSGESEYFINRVPCRLKDIRSIVRTLNLTARGYTVIAQGEISRVVTARPEERRMLIEEIAQVAGFRDQIKAVKLRLDETTQSFEKLVALEKEVNRNVQNLRRQAERAAERQQLTEELKSGELKLFSGKFKAHSTRISELSVQETAFGQQSSQLGEELAALQTSEKDGRAQLLQCDESISKIRGESDTLQREITRRERDLAERESKVRELFSLMQVREDESRRLNDRFTLLQTRLQESEARHAKTKEELVSLTARLSDAEPKSRQELSQLNSTIHEAREKLKKKDFSLREARDKLVASQAKLEALAGQVATLSPLSDLKKILKEEDLRDLRLLVDLITVPAGIAKALQAVLVEKAGFLAAKDPFLFAKAALEAAKNRGTSVGKLGLGVFRFDSDQRPSEHRDILPLKRLIDLLEVDTGIQFALEQHIGDVYLADDLEAAFRVLHENPVQEGQMLPRIVTLAGEVLSWNAFQAITHEGGLIQLKVKIAEIEQILCDAKTKHSSEQSEREIMQQELQSFESRQSVVRKEIEDAERVIRSLTSEKGQAAGRLAAEERQVVEIQRELSKIQEQTQHSAKTLAQLASAYEEAKNRVSEWSNADGEELKEKLKLLADGLKVHEETRRSLHLASHEALRKSDIKRREIDSLRAKRESIRLELRSLEVEIQKAEELVTRDYGQDELQKIQENLENLCFLEPNEQRDLSQSVAGLRHKLVSLKDYGAANVEEFESESARLEELRAQRLDLEKAREATLESLSRLEVSAKERFLVTFAAVQEHFTVMIPELFGGGEGKLSLSDPENPLDCGVELTVKPPGKKPKSIDLLSGGEKALTAVALIFSMFMVRPSPLCVLDEVDAPLDDANVERFLTFVKKMSSRTQFMLITHNKRSMAAADTLVGVTQEQLGASKVISVTLTEAIEQAA